MDTKSSVLISLVCSVILFSSIAYALTTTILSQKKTVTVHDYSLSMNLSSIDIGINETLTISGQLIMNGQGIGSKIIQLFANNTNVDSTTTDVNGFYAFTWSSPTVGATELYTKAEW